MNNYFAFGVRRLGKTKIIFSFFISHLMRKIHFFILSLFVWFSLGIGTADTHTLTVQITGADNDNGYILLILFQGEDGFPSNPDKAHAYDGSRIKDGKSTIVFKNLPAGSYAIAALHDENENGKMDTNMLGIPKEAYGASNDANNPFGPPKYKDARFEVNEDMEITIQMRRVFQ